MAEATKQEIIEMIQRMPEDASLEDIMYELYLRAAVQSGREDRKQGRTVSHEDVMRDVERWLQSVGQ